MPKPRKKTGLAGAVAAFAALLAGAVAPAQAAGSTERVGRELVVYTAPAISALFEALVVPFAEHTRRKWGTAVQVTVVTTAVPTAWTTFKAEWPKPSGDVYILYGEHIREGIAKSYLQPLRPHYGDAEWARFDKDALRAMNMDGYAAPFIITPTVIAVQASLPETAVTGWADLGSSEVKGRVTFESAISVGAGYNLVAAAALVQGADWRAWFGPDGFDEEAARPTLELMRRWADNALTLTQGSGTIRPLLARGEALAATWWWANTVQEIKNGMPLRIVYPREGTITAVQAGPVVTSVTDNPLAAIEWVKFVHSDVAAAIGNRLNYLGRIPLAGEEPTAEWKEFASRAKPVPIDEFRALVLNPAYNRAFIDAYSRIVIEGR